MTTLTGWWSGWSGWTALEHQSDPGWHSAERGDTAFPQFIGRTFFLHGLLAS